MTKHLYKDYTKSVDYIARLDLLESVNVSQQHAQTTSSAQDSLHQTTRRQNRDCSLVSVNDSPFEFFIELDCQRRQMKTLKHFEMEGPYVISNVMDKLRQDPVLLDQWKKWFVDPKQYSDGLIKAVFEDIVTRFMCRKQSVPKNNTGSN